MAGCDVKLVIRGSVVVTRRRDGSFEMPPTIVAADTSIVNDPPRSCEQSWRGLIVPTAVFKALDFENKIA
jgi:hypothetical protein